VWDNRKSNTRWFTVIVVVATHVARLSFISDIADAKVHFAAVAWKNRFFTLTEKDDEKVESAIGFSELCQSASLACRGSFTARLSVELHFMIRRDRPHRERNQKCEHKSLWLQLR